MEQRGYVALIVIGAGLITGLIYLIYPRIVRKGLLFGVYVGEGPFEGPEARRIKRSWYVWMISAIVLSIAAGLACLLLVAPPIAPVATILLQLMTFVVLYLRAYYQARRLAPPGPPPPAAAPITLTRPTSLAFPAAAIAVSALLGLLSMGYAWVHYDSLPGRIPAHFGPSGAPDAWRSKSLAGVMTLPLLTFVVGVGLGGFACLTARAKRAIRLSDQGSSLEAQHRFRGAVTRLLSVITVLTSSLLAFIAVSAVQVGMGWRPGISWWVWLLSGLLVVSAVGGTLYLALRLGQGGARLEKANSHSPLTDGLADNRNWVLGIFYVNREDPSILVERRFGFGYTINFGNWKAVLLLLVFLAFVLGISITAGLTDR